jgi:hypothetical protein
MGMGMNGGGDAGLVPGELELGLGGLDLASGSTLTCPVHAGASVFLKTRGRSLVNWSFPRPLSNGTIAVASEERCSTCTLASTRTTTRV